MDLTDYIDNFVEENYGEVSISDTAYHFFILGKKYAEEYMMKEIKSRLIDAATNQDNSTDIGEQTYYNGMVDALGRLRDKFMED